MPVGGSIGRYFLTPVYLFCESGRQPGATPVTVQGGLLFFIFCFWSFGYSASAATHPVQLKVLGRPS